MQARTCHNYPTCGKSKPQRDASKKTDVRRRRHGTTIMMSKVVCGDTLSAVRPAYERAPTTPAAPAPELHVDT